MQIKAVWIRIIAKIVTGCEENKIIILVTDASNKIILITEYSLVKILTLEVNERIISFSEVFIIS